MRGIDRLVAQVVLGTVMLTLSGTSQASACYAYPARIASAMAVVVATYKCRDYERALFGKPLDRFIRSAAIIDQSTGACELERTLGMNAATERMLAGREAFCAAVEASLASDPSLAQALVEAGARKAP
jgi:hypothetical protein